MQVPRVLWMDWDCQGGRKRKMPTIPIKMGIRGIVDTASGCLLIWGDLVTPHWRLSREKGELTCIQGEKNMPNGRGIPSGKGEMQMEAGGSNGEATPSGYRGYGLSPFPYRKKASGHGPTC